MMQDRITSSMETPSYLVVVKDFLLVDSIYEDEQYIAS
jgi:hypothetical protein